MHTTFADGISDSRHAFYLSRQIRNMTQSTDPKNKRRDTVPLWIMGFIVLVVIGIALYGTQS